MEHRLLKKYGFVTLECPILHLSESENITYLLPFCYEMYDKAWSLAVAFAINIDAFSDCFCPSVNYFWRWLQLLCNRPLSCKYKWNFLPWIWKKDSLDIVGDLDDFKKTPYAYTKF
jgi:hypothetical protein